jgi:hypothetical protein
MEDLLDDPSYSSPTFSTDHNASTISNLDNDSDPPDAMGGEHRSSLDMDDLERASDDGSIPSEDEKQAAADDMIMAERTLNLMNDFRNYINDLGGSGGGCGDNNDDSAHDDECGDGVKLPSGGRIGNLMRSWDDNKPGFTSVPYRDNPKIEEGYGDIADDFVLGRKRYSSRILRSSDS